MNEDYLKLAIALILLFSPWLPARLLGLVVIYLMLVDEAVELHTHTDEYRARRKAFVKNRNAAWKNHYEKSQINT